MAKIAVDMHAALARRAAEGTPGCATSRPLAGTPNWDVSDVLCTSGPRDRPFEEQHERVSIAIVVAGSFQYRSHAGREMMTPGSLLLGNAGQCFECGHEHASGDRCLSFRYHPAYFESLASMAALNAIRIPPLRTFSPLVAKACSGLIRNDFSRLAWEELSIALAGQVVQFLASGMAASSRPPPHAIARITAVARQIEQRPDADYSLSNLAREARLSAYHFLRTFESVTGETPHRYVLRVRLQNAALRLLDEPAKKILDIALDCGFGDVSNFNRAFAREFGISPRRYRHVFQISSMRRLRPMARAARESV